MFIDIKEPSKDLEIEVKYKLEGSFNDWAFSFENLLNVKPSLVEKEDIYYEVNNFFFRIRKDLECYSCNFKEKTVQEGLEINFERETTLNDIFFWNEFLSKLKAKVIYRKTKKGISFFKPPFFLELIEVYPIGLFAEIEYQGKPKSINDVKKEIESFINLLGISPNWVEEKSYKDLLLKSI